jgi:TetR/AcrR family transcriptional repressor of nem operon
MSYSKEHNLEIRAKIIDSAARAFRSNGIKNISVPQIMNGVGLTHGGFYTHFKNKDHLAEEACKYAVRNTISELQKIAQNEKPGSGIEKVIYSYLSTAHRDYPDSGCIIPSISKEVSNYSIELKETYTGEVKRLVKFFSETSNKSTKTCSALLSIMVGALTLSRSVSDCDFSNEILDSAIKQAIKLINSTN